MATQTELRREEAAARERVDRAHDAYATAARRRVIAELLQMTVENRQIAGFGLSAEYEYDDEGGYCRYLNGWLDRTPDGDELDGYWTEGLNVEQAVILDLFGIDGTGEGTLTAKQVLCLAAEERISVSVVSPDVAAASRREGR
jgi:hypothetical protein